MNKLDYLFNIDYKLIDKDIKTNLKIYKMKKEYNYYDDYIEYKVKGFFILG
jgi:hypothetical protein